MITDIFNSILNHCLNAQDLINSTPLWLRVAAFALYSLMFGSLFGSILNRRIDPIKEAQGEREYVLLNYGTDIAPELPCDPYKDQTRSVCPKCQNKLKFYHNIPLISYILLRGHCGFCDNKISKSYPIIESSIMILMIAFGYTVNYQMNLQCFWFLVLSITVVSISFTDIKTLSIYDIDSLMFCMSVLSILNITHTINVNTVLELVYITTIAAVAMRGIEFVAKMKTSFIGNGDFPLIVAYLITLSTMHVSPSYDVSAAGLYTALLLMILPIIELSLRVVKNNNNTRNKVPFAPIITIGTSLLIISNGRVLEFFNYLS